MGENIEKRIRSKCSKYIIKEFKKKNDTNAKYIHKSWFWDEMWTWKLGTHF